MVLGPLNQIAGDFLACYCAKNSRLLTLQTYLNLARIRQAEAAEMVRRHSSDLYSLTSGLWEGRGTTLWKTM